MGMLLGRVGKNPGFFNKTLPSGFFWVFLGFFGFYWVFLGFFGFFWVFLIFFFAIIFYDYNIHNFQRLTFSDVFGVLSKDAQWKISHKKWK